MYFCQAKATDLQTPIKKTVIYFGQAKMSHDLTTLIGTLKLVQEAQTRLNRLEATITEMEQRFEAKRVEVERLTQDCETFRKGYEDYRDDYMNTARTQGRVKPRT